MKSELIKFTLVLIGIFQGVSGYAFEKNVLFSECSNVSVLQSSTLDDCSLCGCFTHNSKFRLTSRSNCVITEDVLERIMDQLFDAWRIITGTFSTTSKGAYSTLTQTTQTCNVGLERFHTRSQNLFSSQCDNLISDIESMIQDITEQIRLLIAWLDDPENFNPRVVLLEQCLKCVNRRLDDTIAQYEQNLGDIREKFGEMQQCLTDSINQRKEEIRQLEVLLEQKTYELVTGYVNASNFPLAFTAFTKLNNDTLLDTLVNDLYGHGSTQLENILIFAYVLTKPEQRGQVYSKLINFMQRKQHHITQRMLSVNKILKDDIGRLCHGQALVNCSTLPDSYKTTLLLVNAYTERVVRSLAFIVCFGDYKSILLTGSSEVEANLAGNALNQVLPNIIERAFRLCSYNLHIISDFVRDLRWNKQKVTGFTKLMSIVSNTNDKLKLAFKMKHALENLRGPDGQEEEAKDFLFALKNRLPGNVRSLVWQTSCTIKSNLHGYLYSSSNIGADNTGIGIKAELVVTSNWAYEAIERPGGEYHFRIRNIFTGEYLGTHVPWKNSGGGYGFVATRKEIDNEYPPRDFHFQVRFSGDSNLFGLYHIGRKAYLESIRSLFWSSVWLLLLDDSRVPAVWINTCDS